MATESYYRALGDGHFASTAHAQGAWNPGEQHMAPATGLLMHALEAHEPRPDMRVARVALDIHGVIHGGEFEVRTRTVRPGRTIELLEAEMVCQGRTAIVARAWRLATRDSSVVAGIEDERIPGPEDLPVWEGMNVWPGGFIASLEFRTGPIARPGRGIAWIRTPIDMVEGVPTSDLVRLIGLVDTANGVASRVEPGPGSWMFPNVDLQIHLHRSPRGGWLGVDVRQSYGTDGIGLTSTVLHDVDGPVGRAEQILTVRPLPPAAA